MYPYYGYLSDLWMIACFAAMLLCYVNLSASQQDVIQKDA